MEEAAETSSKPNEPVTEKKECPVCFKEFSSNDHRLKLLACTHQVCIGCVKQMDKCPICKERLNVVDLESADFVTRRGFNCFTCTKRRTSDKMRICLCCSEAKGFLVKPGKLEECSECIFCSECIIDDHMEQGHRQEKLINYDHEYKTIKQMQKTCLTMKPILEKISNGLEERADRYRNLMKTIELVLSSDVDIHFADFNSACNTLEKCLNIVNGEAEIDRKFEKIQRENEVILEQKVDSAVKIRALQEEINVMQMKLNEKVEEHNKEQQKWEKKIERLAEEISKRNEMISSGDRKKHELMQRLDVFLGREEAEELRKQQEAEELRQQQKAEELRKQQEAEELRKQQKAEELRKQQEAEELQKQKEAEELRKQKEAEELRKQKEAELRKQKEAEELRKQQEEKERKLQEALKNPVYLERFDYPDYPWPITPSSINRLYISVTKPMYLCGISMYCSTTQTDAKFTIRITGPNNVDTSVHGQAWCNGNKSTEVNLETPLQMTPGCKYLLDLTVDKQCEIWFGSIGESSTELENYPGYKVEFSNCEGSGTTVNEGQLGAFYFAPIPC